jgi:hypothetical protein
MAKISELSDGGSLQSTDFLIAVRSGGNVKVQADGNLSLGTVTADGLTVDTTTLVVDATNDRVGIGTASPSSAKLQVKGAGTTVSTNSIFAENSGGAGLFAIRDNGDAFILGNTGIGGITPTGLLTLGTGTFSAAAANTSALYTSTTAGLVAVADGFLLVDRAGADVFKVDTDGNLLVGKTATNFATTGVQLFAGGFLHATASQATAGSGNVVSFSRNTTDGDIAIFAKDGSPVGSIGSALKSSVSRLMIGTGETNLYFFDTDNTIYPVDADGTDSDADTDLGASGARFKDLYLSGGVYLGGTGAANKLDDYEEGTWTPVYSGTTVAGTGTYTRQSGVYVKIGNLVFVSCTIGISAHTGSGSVEITGLPFQVLNNVGNYSGISLSFNDGHTTTSGYQIIGFPQVGSSSIKLYETGGTGQQNTLALDTAFTEFDFSLVYRST